MSLPLQMMLKLLVFAMDGQEYRDLLIFDLHHSTPLLLRRLSLKERSEQQSQELVEAVLEQMLAHHVVYLRASQLLGF